MIFRGLLTAVPVLSWVVCRRALGSFTTKGPTSVSQEKHSRRRRKRVQNGVAQAALRPRPGKILLLLFSLFLSLFTPTTLAPIYASPTPISSPTLGAYRENDQRARSIPSHLIPYDTTPFSAISTMRYNPTTVNGALLSPVLSK